MKLRQALYSTGLILMINASSFCQKPLILYGAPHVAGEKSHKTFFEKNDVNKLQHFYGYITSDTSVYMSFTGRTDYSLGFYYFKNIDLNNCNFLQGINLWPGKIASISLSYNTFKGNVFLKPPVVLPDNITELVDRKITFISQNNIYKTVEIGRMKFDTFTSDYDSFDSLNCNAEFVSLNMENVIGRAFSINALNKGLTSTFSRCRIGSLSLSGYLPDTISLSNTSVEYISVGPQVNERIILIKGGTSIGEFRTSISNFQIVFENVSLADQEKFAQKLFDQQKNKGIKEDIQKADIFLKNILVKRGDISLFIQKHVWLYGYNKVLIVNLCLIIFLIFYIINIFAFKKLINQVYTIENLLKAYNLRFRNKKYPCISFKYYGFVFVYSALVYFGLKMDVDNFKFNKLWWTLYVYLFYIWGLFFLFYIVSFFLSK